VRVLLPPHPSCPSTMHLRYPSRVFPPSLQGSPYLCPRHWFWQPIKPRRIQTLPPPLTSGEEN
jgi:hypothetical protein